MIRRSGLFVTAGLLAVALTAVPTLALAQSSPAPAAIVEADPADVNAWGFAASVPVGGTVTWTNLGAQSHTVTASDASFDSGLVSPGSSVSIVFSTPGTYAYTCTPHPWMKGFVVVTPDGASATPMAMVEGDPSDINTWGFAESVSAGQSIAWTNLGAQPHTVTATDGSFDTGILGSGSTGSLEFDTPGIYAYLCAVHPSMKGSVAVN